MKNYFKTHGMTATRPYRIWDNIRGRCCRTSNTYWKNYGGRGITICDTWKESFISFWNDMKDGYTDDLMIERRDNTKGYYKENCYWATRHEQDRNKRSNIWVDTPWGNIIQSDAAKLIGIDLDTFRYRMKNWPRSQWFEPNAGTRPRK